MNGAPPGSALELRDIHAAPAPEFWPPAPGWWLAVLVAVVVLTVVGRIGYRRWCDWRRKRFVLRALAQLRKSHASDQRALAVELSILLRRVALARYPRVEVAGLSGVQWLQFLDETGGAGQFVEGAGRVLASAPYAPVAELEVDALCTLVGKWVKQNA